MRTSLKEGIKPHGFAGIFPEYLFSETSRHREPVVAADQRMVIRCFRDDLAVFVYDVLHVPPPIQRALSRPSCCRQNGNQDIGEVADQSDTSASRNPGHVDDGARLGSSAMRHPWWQSSDGIDLRQARWWPRPSVRQPTQCRPARQGTQVPARTVPAFSPSTCGEREPPCRGRATAASRPPGHRQMILNRRW